MMNDFPDIMMRGRLEMSSLIILVIQISGSQAISCTAILQSLDCLPAFTHAPSSLAKCYCSSLCPSIEELRQNCPSGQLQTDPCGVCLQCAPGVSWGLRLIILRMVICMGQVRVR